MREIKFRAWTGDDMVDVSAIIFDEGTKVSPYEPHILDSHNDVHLLKDIELMQYTGLHDKNGVEIYEGDILQGTMGDETWIVKFNKGCFQVFSYGEADYCLQDFYDEVTVIGNIHENPELLESPDA